MSLPAGRSRTVLLGAAVLVVLAGASFLVFNLVIDSVSSRELPIIRIGQVAHQTGEEQEQTGTKTVTSEAAGASVSSGAPSSGRVDSSSGPGSNSYTQTTVRQFVQEDVRIQGSWSTRDDSYDRGDRDGGSSRRPGSGRR